MAYNLTKLKDDIKEIVVKEIDTLRNGFQKELVGEMKIQMAESWDVLAGTVETKISAANLQLKDSFERHRQETTNKLEYFPSILQSLNELSKDVKTIEEKREECVKTVTAHMARANGIKPKVENIEKRVDKLEDRPGMAALIAWRKILWIVAGAVIPALLYGGYKLIEFITGG